MLLVAIAVGAFATSLQTMLGLHGLIFLGGGLAAPLLVAAGWLAVGRAKQPKRSV